MKKLLLGLLFTVSALISLAQNSFDRWVPTSGTNTYTTNITGFPLSYNNTKIYIRFGNANTANSTIAINILAAIPIRLWDGDSWELVTAGQIPAGSNAFLDYDNTNSYYKAVIDENLGAGGNFVESVTGSVVDNTDPANPVINAQAPLVSGTNIKTVNGSSLLGSGNIAVGTVTSVNSGNGITVDNTDPVNPIVNLGGTLDQNTQLLTLGTESLQFGFGNLSSTNTLTVNHQRDSYTVQLIDPSLSENSLTFDFSQMTIQSSLGSPIALISDNAIGVGSIGLVAGELIVLQAEDDITLTQTTTGHGLTFGLSGVDLTISGDAGGIGHLIQGGTAGHLQYLNPVATGNVLLSGGVAAINSWGKVGLTTHVSGVLPTANGGTGSSTVNFWPLTGSASLTGDVVINGGGTRNINLGQSSNELAFFGVQATTDYHLFTGSNVSFLGQYSIVAGSTKEMETTVALSGVYDIGIRMGGDAGNGGHLNITSGDGSSTTTTFTISGWDAFRINLGSDAVGDFHYTGTSLNQTRLASVAAGSYLRSGGVATAPVWSTTTLPNSASVGDIIFASSANTYTNLADIATGNVLLSGGVGVIPAYGKVTSSHIDATVQTAGLSYLLASGGAATGTITFANGANPFIMTSTNATGTGATAAHQLVVNSLTSGNGLDISGTVLTSGSLAKYSTTTTAINNTLGTNGLVMVDMSGANANASRFAIGVHSKVANTGTTNTNVAYYGEATGASATSTPNIAFQGVGNIQTKGYETTATYNLSLSKYNENTTQSIALIGSNMWITSAAGIVRENTSVSRGQALVMYTGYSGITGNNLGWSVFNTGSSTLTHPFLINQLGVVQLIAGGQFGWVTSTTDSRGTIASFIGHSSGAILITPTAGVLVATTGTITASTMLDIRGTGTTSATINTRFANSSNGVLASLTNDANWLFNGKHTYDFTYTAGGTTGNQTINKPMGSVNIAAAGTAVTVTNSFCTTNSQPVAWIATGGATAYVKNVVNNANGTFTINLGAAATGEVKVVFLILN